MPELVVVVPSRGRPHTVAELAEAFRETCTADTGVVVAVNASDATCDGYVEAERQLLASDPLEVVFGLHWSSMNEALNGVAVNRATTATRAVAFMGDDHRPRTEGWDASYLDALAARPGIVYGNDLLQGENLPTQCAMSTSLVRALGHMAPPVLCHLYLDNYWLTLGRAAGCITYLPDVVVEHVHPVTGKVPWDEGHQRVNQPAMYERDRDAFTRYWAEHGGRDVYVAAQAAGTFKPVFPVLVDSEMFAGPPAVDR